MENWGGGVGGVDYAAVNRALLAEDLEALARQVQRESRGGGGGQGSGSEFGGWGSGWWQRVTQLRILRRVLLACVGLAVAAGALALVLRVKRLTVAACGRGWGGLDTYQPQVQ